MRMSHLDSHFSAFTLESPEKHGLKCAARTDEHFQIELLTQDSTPEKDHLDNSDSSLNKIKSSVYGSEAQLEPAYSQSASLARLNYHPIDEFDQDQFFNPSSRASNCPSKMQCAYPDTREMDNIDRIFSEGEFG